ncbi:MAG: type I secretion system permease/ATPase [Alphaproteobacteria bacterium]|nr:type I secretion system permease/ATPase [Alphaproteobacteria bacterium]
MADAMRSCAPHRQAANVFSLLIALLYLAPTLYMMQVYDRVLTTGGVMTLVFMSAILGVALFTHSYLDGARQRVMVRASLRLDRMLGEGLIRQGFNSRGNGDARSAQILREFDIFRNALQGPGAIAMMDLPYAPLFVLVAFTLHPWIGGLILGGSALLVVIAMLGDRAAKRAEAKASDQSSATYAAAEMTQRAGGTIRALGMQGTVARRLTNARERISSQAALNAFVASRYSGWIRLLRMALQSASLGVGAYLAIVQEISPGALIAASVLAGRALAPIEQIVGAWRQIGQAASARTAIISYLDGAPEDVARTPLPDPAGQISVESVSVRAGHTERLALKSVSFALDAGQALGIIGQSGSGKSTLARILVGAQPTDAGAVRIDGSSISDWDGDSLGRHVGYVPQEPSLFAGTIGENISRFSTAEDANLLVVPAAQAAGAHAMIQRFPQGYDTVLGARGEGLSAGQTQRVALARALFGEPSLLVLDEPNAHLDSEGDNALLATLAAARQRGATVVIMTHRAGILSVVDKMLVLRDGEVEAFGPREEILAHLRKAAVEAGHIRALPPFEPPLEATAGPGSRR